MSGDHEFIEVKDRRWCLGCKLYQSKPKGAVYFPTPQHICPRNTRHAMERDAIRVRPVAHRSSA